MPPKSEFSYSTDGLIIEQEFVPAQNELIEQLRGINHFWVGEDISAAESVVVPPLKSKEVRVSLDKSIHLPLIDFDWRTHDGMHLNLLGLHTRSRAMQSGLLCWSFPRLILGEDFRELETKGKTETVMEVVNFGSRGIAIEAGNGLAAFYSTLGSRLLRGQELADVVGKAINIDGQYGQEWHYIDPNMELVDGDEVDQATGLALKLKPEKKVIQHGLPPTEGERVLRPLSSEIIDYRAYIDQFLVAFDCDSNPLFWVDETEAALEIKPGFNGVINGFVQASIPNFYSHLQSSILEGGKTNWPIRVEILDTAADRDLLWLFMRSLVISTQRVYKKIVYDHFPDEERVAIISSPLKPVFPELWIENGIFVAINFFQDRNMT